LSQQNEKFGPAFGVVGSQWIASSSTAAASSNADDESHAPFDIVSALLN
jgi:hypothetical protein